jgi:TonB family protein
MIRNSCFTLLLAFAAFLPASKAAAQMKVTYDNTFGPATAAPKPAAPSKPEPAAIPAAMPAFQMEDVDQLPEFNGDLAGYLAKNMRYPESARSAKIQGISILEFVVGPSGLLQGVAINVSSGQQMLDEEAIRLFRQMESTPLWKPGTRGGKAVPVMYTLPVTFKL